MASCGNGLPPAINVAGKLYSIIHNSERVIAQEAMGLCNYKLLQIHLHSAGQHPAQLRDTVLHEVLHAISNATELDLAERQVSVLSGQLLDMFERNPKFTRWLLS